LVLIEDGAFVAGEKPVADLASVEEAASFDFVGGKLAAGSEPVDLFGLAA